MSGAVTVGALIINLSANTSELKADFADSVASAQTTSAGIINAWVGVSAETDRASAAGLRLIASLKDEIATVGMTSAELTQHKANLAGVGDEAQVLIARLQSMKDAQESFGIQTDQASAAARKQADAVAVLEAAELQTTMRIRDMVAASLAESAAAHDVAQAVDAQVTAQTRLTSSTSQNAAASKLWQQNMAGVTAAMKGNSDQSVALSAATQMILDRYDPLGTKMRSLQSDLANLRKAMGDSVSPDAIKAFQGLEDEIAKTAALMETAGVDGFKKSGVAAAAGSLATAGATRELITLGHEALTGNFSRMPGSFMVLAERMGSTELLLNPITLGFVLIAGAAIGLVSAFGQAHDELVAVNNAMLVTNNYAGQTRGSMDALAESVAAGGQITIGTSKQLVTQLVASGQIGGKALATVAGLASDYAKATNQDVDGITPKLISMFSDPVAGAQQLNAQMHFLTQTEIDHIATLVRLGETQKAQAELADKLAAAIPPQSKNVGELTAAYNLLAGAASRAWDNLKQNMQGNTDPFTSQVKGLQDNIAQLRTSGADDSDIKAEQDKLNALIATHAKETAAAQDAASAQSAATDKQNAAQLSVNKSQLTHIQQLKDELTLVQSMPDSAAKSEREVELQKQIDDGYRSIGADARAMTQQQITQQETLANIQNQGEADRISANMQLGNLTKEQFDAQMTNNKLDQNAIQQTYERQMAYVAGLTDVENQGHLDKLAALKAEWDLIEQQGINTVNKDEKDSYDALVLSIDTAAQADLNRLNQEIVKQQQHNDEIGKTKAQIDLVKQATEDSATAQLQTSALAITDLLKQNDLNQDARGIYTAMLSDLNLQIAARQKLAGLNGQAGVLDASAATVKAQTAYDTKSAAEMVQQWKQAGTEIADSLTEAFGQGGKAIGGMFKAYADGAAQQLQIQKQLTDSTKGLATDDPRTIEATARANAESSQAQIKSYGDMAGAAQGFFNTGSTGYAVLGKVEQAFRVAELAGEAETLAAKLFGSTTAVAAQTAAITISTGEVVAQVPVVVAANGVMATAYGTTALAASLVAPPPASFASFAIVAAIIAGLGILVAGGSGSANADTSKATQAAAGTGTVLGDPTAKSDSIANSIAAVQKNTYEGLTVSGAMLTQLQSINTSLSGLGNLVTQELGLTASGASQGAAASVQVGASSSVQFGGALSALDPLANLVTNVLGQIPVIGGLVSKLFGSTTTLTDEGIKIDTTSLSDAIINGVKGVSYADTQTTSKFFGITVGNSSDEQTQALSAELNNQFTAVIKSLHDGTEAAADALGLGGDAFDAKLNSFVVDLGKISLKGLTGDQITTELNNVFSSLGDDMANFAVSGLAQFQQVGEGAFETLTRIANDYQTVDAVLGSFGKSFGDVGFASVAARENLISLSGGLDQFTSQADYFLKNFFTDAEQAAQLKPNVDAAIESVNNGQTVTTSEQFKDLVLSLDLTTTAGQQAYATLMNIAPAFEQIVQATGGKDAADILSEHNDLQDQFDNLTMTSTQLLKKQRDAIDASNLALFDQVQAITAANNALTAASTAGSAALTALQNSVTAQKAAVQAAADAQTAALQTQEDAANATLQSVTSILSTLNSAVDSAQQAQTLTLGMREQAEATITGILKQVTAGASLADVGGDSSGLSEAISTLAQPSTNLYSSFVDYARDQAQANNTLTALQKSAKGQVDTAQEMVDQLTAQIKAVNDQTTAELARLDALVTTGQAQLDAANGTNDAVLSLQEAINNLSTAIAGISATSSANSGGSQGAPTDASAAASIAGLYESELGRAPEAAGAAFWLKAYDNGESLADIAKDIEASPEYKALHPFAVGTNYIPQDMPAYVHEGERIIPAADNRELMARLSSPAGNSDALLAEIKALRQTVAKQQKHLSNISEATGRSADMYEQNTAKGGPSLVQIVGKVTVAS